MLPAKKSLKRPSKQPDGKKRKSSPLPSGPQNDTPAAHLHKGLGNRGIEAVLKSRRRLSGERSARKEKEKEKEEKERKKERAVIENQIIVIQSFSLLPQVMRDKLCPCSQALRNQELYIVIALLPGILTTS